MKKSFMLIVICSIAAVSQAVLIDDFQDGNMDEYVQTVILDTGGYPPEIEWFASSGAVWAAIQTYDGIEQGVAMRDDYSLGIGDTLKIDTTGHIDGNQDLGLVVMATKTPTYNERVDYVNVYMRTDTQVYSRGFDGTAEFPLAGGSTPDTVDALFIERIAADQFTAGYYIGTTKTVLVTRTVDNTGIGTAIGLYTDMRSANTHGGLDNLEIISVPVSPEVISNPDDLALQQGENAVFQTVFTSSSTPLMAWYEIDASGDIFMDPLESDIDVQLTYDAQSEQYTSTLTMTGVMPADSGRYYCRIINDSGIPVDSEAAALIVYGMVAHWTLDQSRYDGSYYLEEIAGLNAEVTGTPTFVEGADGASNAAVQITSDAGMASIPIFDPVRQSGQITVSFWANGSETSVTQLDLTAESSGDEVLTMSDGLKVEGQWQHICTVLDGTTGKLYVDGILRDQGSWQLPEDTRASIRLGVNSSGFNAFNGAMDDVRIFNYALDEYEVAQLRYSLSGERSCILAFDASYDLSGPDAQPDCIIDLYDLAAFANQWLASYSLEDFAEMTPSWQSSGLYPIEN